MNINKADEVGFLRKSEEYSRSQGIRSEDLKSLLNTYIIEERINSIDEGGKSILKAEWRTAG